jgi:hypothetical protein
VQDQACRTRLGSRCETVRTRAPRGFGLRPEQRSTRDSRGTAGHPIQMHSAEARSRSFGSWFLGRSPDSPSWIRSSQPHARALLRTSAPRPTPEARPDLSHLPFHLGLLCQLGAGGRPRGSSPVRAPPSLLRQPARLWTVTRRAAGPSRPSSSETEPTFFSTPPPGPTSRRTRSLPSSMRRGTASISSRRGSDPRQDTFALFGLGRSLAEQGGRKSGAAFKRDGSLSDGESSPADPLSSVRSMVGARASIQGVGRA